MLSNEEFDEILDRLGEVPRDPELLLEYAVDSGHLVLRDDEERSLFWGKVTLITPLLESEVLWDFFINLAKHSKSGTSLDSYYYPNKADGYVRKMASRIRREMELPPDLSASIVTGKRHDQRINLPPEKIRVFESDGRGGLREWLP